MGNAEVQPTGACQEMASTGVPQFHLEDIAARVDTIPGNAVNISKKPGFLGACPKKTWLFAWGSTTGSDL